MSQSRTASASLTTFERIFGGWNIRWLDANVNDWITVYRTIALTRGWSGFAGRCSTQNKPASFEERASLVARTICEAAESGQFAGVLCLGRTFDFGEPLQVDEAPLTCGDAVDLKAPGLFGVGADYPIGIVLRSVGECGNSDVRAAIELLRESIAKLEATSDEPVACCYEFDGSSGGKNRMVVFNLVHGKANAAELAESRGLPGAFLLSSGADGE